MIRKTGLFIIILLATIIPLSAQTALQPGFSANEYLQMLEIFNQQAKHSWRNFFAQDTSAVHQSRHHDQPMKIPAPENYHWLYTSPDAGLYNSWELWLNDDSVAVISVRGTVNNTPSWLENFYAAMTPAHGTLQLNDSTYFNYQLARDSGAAVHVGWLIGMAFMAPDIVTHIQQLYKTGVHQFIITGHSQGGAIAYLLSSYLHYLPDSILPKNIFYKIYCSAAPSPGNAYYAYDFDYVFRNRAFHIINASDWVPQVPLSVETLDDLNKANPFSDLHKSLKKQKWLARIYLNHVYNKLDRSLNKAEKNLHHYLGPGVFKQIHKILPQLREPQYAGSMNFMAAGTPIILQPYEGYFKEFVYDGKNVFVHHSIRAYYELTKHEFQLY